jgi:hypothetical protein
MPAISGQSHERFQLKNNPLLSVILSMTPTAPVKSKKDERGYRVENVVKGGAGFAPFILPLTTFSTLTQSSGVETKRLLLRFHPS